MPNCFRVVNHKDSIPKVPIAPWFSITRQYEHVGRPLIVNSNTMKEKRNSILGFTMNKKDPDFLESIVDPLILGRHMEDAYFEACSKLEENEFLTVYSAL